MGSKTCSSSESKLSGKEDERGVKGGLDGVEEAGGGLTDGLEAMFTGTGQRAEPSGDAGGYLYVAGGEEASRHASRTLEATIWEASAMVAVA